MPELIRIYKKGKGIWKCNPSQVEEFEKQGFRVLKEGENPEESTTPATPATPATPKSDKS